jgi:hypothetical protein
MVARLPPLSRPLRTLLALVWALLVAEAIWGSSVLLARAEGGRWWLCFLPLLGPLAYAYHRRYPRGV